MLIALASSGALYFMSTYGISIDDGMVQNVFETDTAEATALFSWKLVSYLLLLGVLPASLIALWPVRYSGFFRGL